MRTRPEPVPEPEPSMVDRLTSIDSTRVVQYTEFAAVKLSRWMVTVTTPIVEEGLSRELKMLHKRVAQQSLQVANRDLRFVGFLDAFTRSGSPAVMTIWQIQMEEH